MFGLPKEIAGTVVAAVIAAFISLLGLIISKENKVSEFRQMWIDSLREEIATIITHATAVRVASTIFKDNAIMWEDARGDFVALNGAWAKVKLRLNPTEAPSIAVRQALEAHEILFKDGKTPEANELAKSDLKLLECTQVVLS